MKKDMPLEGLRWSRDSGSTLCDTPQNGRSRTGWGGMRGAVTLRGSAPVSPPSQGGARGGSIINLKSKIKTWFTLISY